MSYDDPSLMQHNFRTIVARSIVKWLSYRSLIERFTIRAGPITTSAFSSLRKFSIIVGTRTISTGRRIVQIVPMLEIHINLTSRSRHNSANDTRWKLTLATPRWWKQRFYSARWENANAAIILILSYAFSICTEFTENTTHNLCHPGRFHQFRDPAILR